MPVTDLTIGGADGRVSAQDQGREFRQVDMSVTPLAAGSQLRVFNVPKGTLILGIRAQIETADSVAAATVDVGLYGADDDAAIDADSLLNELAIGAVAEVTRTPATAVALAEDAWVGICQGAGGAGAENNDAVINLTLLRQDLNYD